MYDLKVIIACGCMIVTQLAIAKDFHCSQLVNYPISTSTTQVLVVTPSASEPSKAALIACEADNNTWHLVRNKDHQELKFDAIVGKNGIAAAGTKVEGDNKTPSGLFYLGEVFGYYSLAASKIPQLKMDYRYIVDTKLPNHQPFDKFIDDSNSPENNYNSWVIGPTNATSFESMLQGDYYEYGVVVNYNMNPAVPSKGSAIFLHVWANKDYTSGCVALKKPNLLSVLSWLDKAKQPQIMILANKGSKS